MHRGDMVVKVWEHNKRVDVPIKEGEMFLLPRRIPHSPQRYPNTIGLVIEREREEGEIDCLRWYVPDKDAPEPLYEEFFVCHDLGVQLKPVIQRFFASEQHKTNVPIEGTIKLEEEAPVHVDSKKSLPRPFALRPRINEILPHVISSTHGCLPIDFKPTSENSNEGDKSEEKKDEAAEPAEEREFLVHAVAGPNASSLVHCRPNIETWIWQWSGSAKLTIFSAKAVHALQHFDSSSPLANLATATFTTKNEDGSETGPKEDERGAKEIFLNEGDSQLIPIHVPYSITPINEEKDGEDAASNGNSTTILISMLPIKS